MKKLILIRGPICAGKSTTIGLLKQNLKDVSVVDFDAFKRAVDYTKSSGWRTDISFKTALFLAGEIMKKDRTIIADIHSSIPNQYNGFKELAEKQGYEFHSFLIYPPLETCLKRNAAREIPDVDYRISEEKIIEFWKETYNIKEEVVFDSSMRSPKEIVTEILANLNI